MLLAELAPKDFRQLYICHKPMFYALYATWSEAKKAFAVRYLQTEYQVDKVAARKALFGHDAPMEVPEPAPDMDELVEIVGPWGPVRRSG
jgi:hypothetical protein